MRTVNTENSTYEIDESNRLVRRMYGVSVPTPRQGADGEWKAYREVLTMGDGLLFVWGDNPDGTAKCTWTSKVVSDTNDLQV